MTDTAVAWRIRDDEARIRAWIELNTIGRIDPGAPIRYDINDLISLCESLDEGRREISRCHAVIRELEEKVSDQAIEEAEREIERRAQKQIEALDDAWAVIVERENREARAAALEDAAEALLPDYVFHDDNDLKQRDRVLADTFRSAIRALAPADGQPEPGRLTRERIFYAKGRAAGIKEASQYTAQDEWITWYGGECPIPDGVAWECFILGQNSSQRPFGNASKMRWNHLHWPGDILAYRVVRQ